MFIIENMEIAAGVSSVLVLAAWIFVEIFFAGRIPSPGFAGEIIIIAILLPLAALPLFVA